MLKRMYTWHDVFVLVSIIASALSQPLNNTSGDYCTDNNDCTAGKICVDLSCVDPCFGVCGLNTFCIVQDDIPVCSCKDGYFGDPFKNCNLVEVGECTNNAQCSPDKACIGQRCVDPCQHGCGLNTECRVVDHRPRCACLRGFIYHPQGCKPTGFCNITYTAVPECSSNEHCAEDRACRQQRCVDPCEEGICGNNTVCNVRNHYPVCACQVGFLGDATKECVPFCKDYFKKNLNVTVPEKKKKSFIYIDLFRNWGFAVEDCYSKGMRLAMVDSEEEWVDLKASLPSIISGFWLGGHDLGRYSDFVWATTGKRLTYSDWGRGEPYGLDNHCLFAESDKKWGSSKCSNGKAYVCEFQLQ